MSTNFHLLAVFILLICNHTFHSRTESVLTIGSRNVLMVTGFYYEIACSLFDCCMDFNGKQVISFGFGWVFGVVYNVRLVGFASFLSKK